MVKFEKVLVANRGEIAVRIIRALRELEIASVAVYSTADQEALHVREADEAICIGGPKPGDSYLNMQNIVSAALLTGAQAIHPGYGFLSESDEFAQLCAECQLTFIGPQAEIIALMGNKANARMAMQQNQVPVIPGSEGFVQDAQEALEIAEQVGFPVMLKAASGGGGKGIRKVFEAKDLKTAFIQAQEEAQISFGDSRMYLEKIISPAKHIEVQVVADQQGHVVALPERDCSLQRKQQKVLEETPCVLINEQERSQLQHLAVTAVQAINYENVGTVEFLMDPEHNFYFMEMNTRIQVEHSISEEVTNIDLVQEQIKIAQGQELQFSQDDISVRGVSIEARINAEDPSHNFQPQAGVVDRLSYPGGRGIRIESGIESGDRISPFYDSMIVKIIASGDDRPLVLRRMLNALHEFKSSGLDTNRDFLIQLLQEDAVRQGTYLTTYLDQEFLPKYLLANDKERD